MKLKVKIKKLANVSFPTVLPKGDWIDLHTAEEVTFCAPQSGVLKQKTINGATESYRDVTFEHKLIPLGVAVELPDGFEAHLLPRSSSYKKYGIIVANSMGIVDNSYCGNNDEWKLSALGLKHTTIPVNTRICQFKIVLNQKATLWQKIKWLFTDGIELVETDNLIGNDRHGFGSTN